MRTYYNNYIPIYKGGKNIFGRLLNSTEASLSRYASRIETKNKELSNLVKELAASKKDPKKIFSDDKYDKLRELLKKKGTKTDTSVSPTTDTTSGTSTKAKGKVKGAVDAASERVEKGKKFLSINKKWLIPTVAVAGSGPGRWALGGLWNVYSQTPDLWGKPKQSTLQFININGVKTPITTSDGINFTVASPTDNNNIQPGNSNNGVSDADIDAAYNSANQAAADNSVVAPSDNVTLPSNSESLQMINDLFEAQQW